MRCQEPWEFALASGRVLRGIVVKATEENPKGSEYVTLLVHGWMDNAASFRSILSTLPTGDNTCISVDLAGHGLSDHLPPDGHYVVTQYALDICNLVKALSSSYEHINLIGHSLGAGVCLLVERVCDIASLVLIEGIGPMSNEDGLLGLRSAAAAVKWPEPAPRYSFSEAVQRRAGSTIAPLSNEEAQELVKRGTRENEDGTFSFIHDRRLNMRSLMTLTESQVQDSLRGVRAPSLLILDGGGLWGRLFDVFGLLAFTSTPIPVLSMWVISRCSKLWWLLCRLFSASGQAQKQACRFNALCTQAHNSLVRFRLIPGMIMVIVNASDEQKRGHHPHLGDDKGREIASMINGFWDKQGQSERKAKEN